MDQLGFLLKHALSGAYCIFLLKLIRQYVFEFFLLSYCPLIITPWRALPYQGIFVVLAYVTVIEIHSALG